MYMRYISLCLLSLAVLLTSSCEIDEQFDPNGPSLNSVLTNASRTELNLLVSGTEARMRNGLETFVTSTGTIARELYRFDADPRNTEDLLGKDDLTLDANTFYLTAPYNTRYRVVKNCNTLLDAIANTDQVSEVEKDGYRGFANTIKAYMLSQVLGMLGDNGIRVDVDEPDNPGPFLSEQEAYTAIRDILDEGFDQLQGAEFAFSLSSGFNGFDTPETFAQFNRAIAARVAIYDEDYAGALSAVNNSFLDLDGPLNTGPKHIFSTSAGDILNGLFKAPGQSGDQIIVHNSYLEDAIDGDARLDKFGERVNATSQDGLNGTHETRLYESATSPIDIIRNEELILILAEASIQQGDFPQAVEAIDKVRVDNNIGVYTGPETEDALIDEMLFQRRYSFWAEGQRMFDLRRYGRLNEDFLPIDREGDDVFQQFPIPLTEGV